jgi:putative acetyltransferase
VRNRIDDARGVGHAGDIVRSCSAEYSKQNEALMIIRNENDADITAITEVTIEAFKNLPVSNQTEQCIINALRSAGVLTISLVAEIDGKIVGHVAFSPVTISDNTTDWYGLGPVSVKPDFQKNGVGKALINKGLALLKERGARGCALVGDPDYYKHFGFKNYPELIYDGIPQKYFVVLPFAEIVPKGFVVFHEGFSATS